MKIIIGSESFSPNISGVAVHAELLAKNLARKGNKVYLFAPSRGLKTDWDNDFKEYKVLRLKSVINPFRDGFRVSFMPKKDIFTAATNIKPDLIHLQDPTSICSALLKFAKKNNIPVVATNHFSLDYVVSYLKYLKPFHPQIRYFLKKHLTRFYNQCNQILCPTETVKKDLIVRGVETPITAISNGVDLDRFFSYSDPSEIRLKYHLPMNLIVLYVGRIDKDKNIEVMVRAIPEVCKKTNAHFVFAGLGDEIPKMKKLVEKLKITRETSFLGKINYSSGDLPLIYQIASVFAIPSTIETQSIVTLEAMASGLPIVAANAGALPELVSNGENGYLFPAGNFEKMGEEIAKILVDFQLQKKMKKKSLEIVSSHQIEKSFKSIAEVYEKVKKNHLS